MSRNTGRVLERCAMWVPEELVFADVYNVLNDFLGYGDWEVADPL